MSRDANCKNWLFGTERFGASDLLQVVWVATLHDGGWEQGRSCSLAMPAVSFSPQALRGFPKYLEPSSAVPLLELNSSPRSTAKVVSLGTANLSELLGGGILTWGVNKIIREKREMNY